MEIILWIIFGAIAGSIAGMIMKSPRGIGEDIVLGILGGFLGGFLLKQFGQTGVTGFNFYSLFVAILGAIILIMIGRALHK